MTCISNKTSRHSNQCIQDDPSKHEVSHHEVGMHSDEHDNEHGH